VYVLLEQLITALYISEWAYYTDIQYELIVLAPKSNKSVFESCNYRMLIKLILIAI